jgi:hypothetical protein
LRLVAEVQRLRAIVPLLERSLEIFGHENTLDRLIRTTLFEHGKHTLDLFRCRRVTPASQPKPVGHLLLIAENSDTFDSLIRALTTSTQYNLGLVDWGAGCIRSIGTVHRPPESAGPRSRRLRRDLDANRLRAPRNAAATLAAQQDLPVVQPTVGLYEALSAQAQPQQRWISLCHHRTHRLARSRI